MEFKSDALMLRSVDFKDNDKILTVFTLDKGKISASIKGVKKAGAKLKFAAQPFCFAEYIFAGKSDRNTVTGATLIDSFYEIRNDLLKFYSAFALMQLSDAILPENYPAPKFFISVINGLKQLCYENCSERAVLIKVMLDAIDYMGYKLSFDKCCICDKQPDYNNCYINFDRGSIVCSDCKQGVKISFNTINVIKNILNDTYTKEKYIKDGEIRAIRLLSSYIFEKTSVEISSIKEIINL